MVRWYVAVLGVVAVTATAAYAAQNFVGQKGRLFSPGAMSVKAGEAVVFKNDDSVTHHIYSSSRGHEFDLKTTSPGEDAQHTFTKRGRVDVRCGLHPGMRLVITVN